MANYLYIIIFLLKCHDNNSTLEGSKCLKSEMWVSSGGNT